MKPSARALVCGLVRRGASLSIDHKMRHFGNICGDKRACAETPLTVMSSRSFPLGRKRKGKIMRKLAIAVALSSTLLATPAFARNGAWYVGGEFGAMIAEDTHVKVGTRADTFIISHDYGYDGGIFVGYDLGAFR